MAEARAFTVAGVAASVGICAVAYSSGTRNLVKLAAAWAFAAAISAFTFIYFDAVRDVLGLKLDPSDFGALAGTRGTRRSDPRRGRIAVERASATARNCARAHAPAADRPAR